MKPTFATACALLLGLAACRSAQVVNRPASTITVTGLDAPQLEEVQPPGAKSGAFGVTTRTCQVFEEFAVLWVDDGSKGGVGGLEVRRRAPGAEPAALCAQRFDGVRILSGDPEPVTGGAPAGVAGWWLVLDGVDCQAEGCGVGIVDLKTGRKVLDDEYLVGRGGVKFERRGGELIVTYWAPRIGERCSAAPELSERPELQVWLHVRRSLPSGAVVLLPDDPICAGDARGG
jgi:hypothetical protein